VDLPRRVDLIKLDSNALADAIAAAIAAIDMD